MPVDGAGEAYVQRTLGIGGHHRPYWGESDDWLTPPELLKALGEFDLDPCASIGQPWATARKQYTALDNGLALPWEGRVFLNPPYGPATGKWLARLAGHGNGIALTFARTETAMFHAEVWPKARGLLFLRGRLHFHRPDGTRSPANCGGPSVLIAYDEANMAALRSSALPGALVEGASCR